jgi:hypothetical protein
MNDRVVILISAGIVTLGVVAELNLLRIFVVDWLRGRREERAPSPRARRTRDRSRDAAAGRNGPSRFRRAALAAAAVLTLAPAAHADSPESRLPETSLLLSQPPEPPKEAAPLTIFTNRPSFNDTTGIVPIGHFQLETGYTFTFRDRDGVETQTHNAPELLARIPIIDDRLELQFGTSGYVWSRSNSGAGFESVEGFSDVIAGVRVKIIDQDGWVPRLAFQALTTVGLGSSAISNRDAEPTMKLIWSYDLGSGWGICGNLGAGYLTTSGERFWQGQAGVCLTYTINDQWSVFGEYYVFGPNSKGTDAAHYVDCGAAYLITPRIQLDGRIGVGVNHEANNMFVGAGISFLF